MFQFTLKAFFKTNNFKSVIIRAATKKQTMVGQKYFKVGGQTYVWEKYTNILNKYIRSYSKNIWL